MLPFSVAMFSGELILHVCRYQGERTLTWMNFLETMTVFGKPVEFVSVKKIASGFLSSMEEK